MRWALALAAHLVLVAVAVDARSFDLDPEVESQIATITANDPARRNDAFAKMGGSSAASRAFLHCLASPYVELDGRTELEATIAYFDTGRRNSFNRASLATGVSWNLRYALAGKPARFRREIEATNARWALVLYGGNDAQNKNERIYARRLVYLIEELDAMGVVPVLGSAAPRRTRSRDRWIRRFNAITEAVARHWNVPYIDYYGAMQELPRKGLARDGVHPNVLPPGGVRAACQFTERGLRYGNNVRNLLTLEMLDALRRSAERAALAEAIVESEVVLDPRSEQAVESVPDPRAEQGVVGVPEPPEPAAVTSEPYVAPLAPRTAPSQTASPAPEPTPSLPGPVELEAGADLPFSRVVDKAALAEGEAPSGCGAREPRARTYRLPVEVVEPERLRIVALDLEGFQPRLYWAKVDDEGARCVKRRRQTLEVAASPGLWDLFVEVSERASERGRLLILVDRNPR